MTPRMEARRRRMRAVGARLFALRGLDSVAVLEVARQADVPASPASHGYRRRQDLIIDIVHAHIDAMHEYVGNADDATAGADPQVRLDAIVTALLDGLHDHRHEHRVLIGAFPHLPEEPRHALHYLIRTLLARLTGPLEALLPGLAANRVMMAPLVQSLAGMASHSQAWLRDNGTLTRADYARLISRAVVAGGRQMLADMRTPGRL